MFAENEASSKKRKRIAQFSINHRDAKILCWSQENIRCTSPEETGNSQHLYHKAKVALESSGIASQQEEHNQNLFGNTASTVSGVTSSQIRNDPSRITISPAKQQELGNIGSTSFSHQQQFPLTNDHSLPEAISIPSKKIEKTSSRNTSDDFCCNTNQLYPRFYHQPSLHRHGRLFQTPQVYNGAYALLSVKQASSRISSKASNTHNIRYSAHPPVKLLSPASVAKNHRVICFPLSLDEDQNWLSEFQCFIRSNLIEVFQATPRDMQCRKYRNISPQQVGIRCQYCVNLSPVDRICRSSCFPSKICQIYQSVTMMIRDHFEQCPAIPEAIKERFLHLKAKKKYGDCNSRKYWDYSAGRLGLVDSTDDTDRNQGVLINERSIISARNIPPYGTCPGYVSASYPPLLVVSPGDRHSISEFIFHLLYQFQIIYLIPSEKIGCRRTLPIGLPGLGCRYCCHNNRLGFCRIFPTLPKSMPAKMNHLLNHIRRCTLCPQEVKNYLLQKNSKDELSNTEKEFFNHVWARLGHTRSKGGIN